MVTTTIAAQCMLWQTSPAATEMEGVMINWLRQALGLPEGFTGVIQDSASSATLSAVLTMRETGHRLTGNREGLNGKGDLRIYCSEQVHSSIDRACLGCRYWPGQSGEAARQQGRVSPWIPTRSAKAAIAEPTAPWAISPPGSSRHHRRHRGRGL